MPEFSLINMNGRIYDPILGRFLSPDPFIQAPQYPNSYNRYSYALNNPLRFIDPSGYKYGPSPHERDQINGEGAYYNYELAWKITGFAGSQFGSYMSRHASGGWEFSGPTGGYINSFTGERRSSINFGSDFVSSIVDPSQYASFEWGQIGTSGWIDYSGQEPDVYAKPVYG